MPKKQNYKNKKSNGKPKKKNYNYKKSKTAQRSDFVEQKINQTPERQFTLNGAGSLIVPDCFEFAVQGTAQNQISGRYLFSKWLTMKCLIDYTTIKHEPLPMSYVITQGWCKVNLNPTPPATPGAPFDLETNALQNHVASYFERGYSNVLGNGDVRNIQIIKQFKVNGYGIELTDTDGSKITMRQPKLLKFKWSPMRKIRYQHCKDATNHTFLQCNQENWIPFINFQYSALPHTGEHYPTVNVISTHYYTDA